MTEASVRVRLSPEKGRVAKSRQVPDVVVDIKPNPLMTTEPILTAIEAAFAKYSKHGMYCGVVTWDDNPEDASGRGHTFIYCDRTDATLAKINIIPEKS
ncbi:hypothetical protein SEA_RIE18_66 [Microbacterium phage Rie18]|nr:hypothetical protein SEA_RIE18_66 [Microbacterium phage Rie18]